MREGLRQVHEGGKLARNYGSANIELFIECWEAGLYCLMDVGNNLLPET